MEPADCALQSIGYVDFALKHISKSWGSNNKAAEKSCARNLEGNFFPKSALNSVVFLSRNADFNFYDDSTVNNDDPADPACRVSVPDIWQCSDVDRNVNEANFETCVNNARCNDCKIKYTNANGFEIDVKQNNGHLDYKDSWYVDNEGVKYSLDLSKC